MKKIKYPYKFDPEKRRIAKLYSRQKVQQKILNGIIVPIAVLLALLYSGASLGLQEFSLGLSQSWHVPVFVFFFLSILSLVQLPFRFYSGYIFEHKYGLSNQTVKTWLVDYGKGLFIGYLFGIPILTLVYYLIGKTPQWWLIAGALYFFIELLVNTIVPIFVLPLFYKLKPYADAVQKKKMIGMAERAGVTGIKKVLVAKESEKSKKPNAMFAGFWKTKRIILFDTLLDSFTPAEIETVIAHELGHYVHKDIWKEIVIETLKSFPVLYIASLVLNSYSHSFGMVPQAIATLPLFLLTETIADLLLMPAFNAYSRKIEFEADTFALEVSNKPGAQASTERRLADMALSDDDPHPLIEFVFYSHPCAKKRIALAENWKKKGR